MNTDEIKQKIDELKSLLVFMEIPESNLSFSQLVFQKYIEYESTPKAAKYLQERGTPLLNGKLIQSKNVTEMIKSYPTDVEKNIVTIARNIFYKNYREMKRHHG